MTNRYGFASISIIVLFLLLGLGISYLFLQNKTFNSHINSTITERREPLEEIKLDEGNHTIILKNNSKLLLPSGSKIDRTSFYFDKESRVYENNSISFDNHLKVYHKGYIYDFTKSHLNCPSEPVGGNEYSRAKFQDCEVNINIFQGKPEVIPYNQFTKSFSSRETEYSSYSVISNAQNGPFLIIFLPYTQLYRDSGLQKYTYTTPIGDTVQVFTNYGIKDFKFNLPDDLFNKASKKQQIGPLTVTIKVKGLSCYPPYLRTTGECNGPGEYPVYNRVDFVIDITQDDKKSAEVKILEYK